MPQVMVARVSELKAGQAKAIEVNGKEIALFNVNGKFFAIDNACAHAGGPLGEGELEGKIITCPFHGWQYDVTNGQCLLVPSVKMESFKVTVKGEQIFVDA